MMFISFVGRYAIKFFGNIFCKKKTCFNIIVLIIKLSIIFSQTHKIYTKGYHH